MQDAASPLKMLSQRLFLISLLRVGAASVGSDSRGKTHRRSMLLEMLSAHLLLALVLSKTHMFSMLLDRCSRNGPARALFVGVGGGLFADLGD